MTKNRKAKAFFIYSILFLLLGGVLVCIFFTSGRSMIESSDAAAQHYPVFCYIRSYIRQIGKELLQNHRLVFPMVDFRIGQGLDVLSTLSYYGFCDPLMWFSALFPEKYIVFYYGAMILLHIYLAGAAFLAYCFEIKAGNDSSCIAGAIAYCFCTFMLAGGLKHPMFLEGPLFLPLLLLGAERALRKRKYLFLSFATALCLAANFYFAYMNAIISGCYILIRLFWMKEISVRKRLLQLIKLAAACLAGAGLSAIVLFPTLYAFLNCGRVGQLKLPNLFYPFSHYRKYFSGFLFATTEDPSWTCMGFSALFLPSAAALFTRRRKEGEDWVCPLRTGLLLCMGMICFPMIGKIMNGFSYAANRWFFAGAFAVALTLAYMLPELLKLSKAEYVRMAVVSAAYVTACLVLRAKDMNLYYGAVLICVLLALVISLAGNTRAWKGEHRSWCMSAFVVLSVICAGLHIGGLYLPSYGNYIGEFVQLGRVNSMYTDAATKGMALLDSSQEEAFSRIDAESTTANRSLVNGQRRHSFYFSMTPGELSEFYQSLSLNELQFSDLFRGQAGRTILDEITATRYYATTNAAKKYAPFGYTERVCEDKDSKKAAVIMENEYFLPLGFTYSSYISKDEYEAQTEEKRQQLLLQSAVLEKDIEEVPKDSADDLEYDIERHEVEFHNTEKASYQDDYLQSSASGNRLKLSFEVPAGRETYLLLRGVDVNLGTSAAVFIVKANGQNVRVKLPSKGSMWWFGHDTMLVNMGYSDEAREGCTLMFNGGYRIKIDDIAVISYGMEEYPAQADRLREDVLQNTHVETNRVSGEISLDQGKLLYMSIPYGKGWTAFVDGEKAEILRTNLAYMSLALKKGTHTIVLRYETPYLKLGMIVSLLAVFGILIYWLVCKAGIAGNVRNRG